MTDKEKSAEIKIKRIQSKNSDMVELNKRMDRYNLHSISTAQKMVGEHRFALKGMQHFSGHDRSRYRTIEQR